MLMQGALERQNYDPTEAFEILRSAMAIRASAADEAILDLASPAVFDRACNARRNVVPLGVSAQLDRMLDGGIGNGELLVLLAPPSRGKTSLLCKFGERAAANGSRVLHVSLEISADKVARRYLQAITRHTTRQFTEAKRDAIAEAVAAAQAVWPGGAVRIATWPPKRASVADLQSLVRAQKAKGYGVDYLVVDYAALIKAAGNKRELRWTYGDIVQEMRAVAVEEDLKMLTAWQVNRAGADADEISSTDIAEAWEVIHHADVVMAMNRTPEERRHRVLRLSVLKQRESEQRPTAWLKCDWDTMMVRGLREKEMSEYGFVTSLGDAVDADEGGGDAGVCGG